MGVSLGTNLWAKYHCLGTRRERKEKGGRGGREKGKKKGRKGEGGGASGTEVGYSNFIMKNVPKFK